MSLVDGDLLFLIRQKDMNTLIDLVLPLEDKEDIKVQLIIPYNYPDTQCTLQIQNANMTPQTKRYEHTSL